ncbi:hypothetical protein [Rubellimicrobium roseum]|uniref:hypothetical protein n=1 Tax=Rubellimicrobium roseum TaxID=687525 RepID=UPI001C3F1CDE|nr:hypothetical protein [Rubellimicrobium roseum]
MKLKAGLLALSLALGMTGGAQAATILYATGATIVQDGPRGITNDRNNLALLRNP